MYKTSARVTCRSVTKINTHLHVLQPDLVFGLYALVRDIPVIVPAMADIRQSVAQCKQNGSRVCRSRTLEAGLVRKVQSADSEMDRACDVAMFADVERVAWTKPTLRFNQ